MAAPIGVVAAGLTALASVISVARLVIEKFNGTDQDDDSFTRFLTNAYLDNSFGIGTAIDVLPNIPTLGGVAIADHFSGRRDEIDNSVAARKAFLKGQKKFASAIDEIEAGAKKASAALAREDIERRRGDLTSQSGLTGTAADLASNAFNQNRLSSVLSQQIDRSDLGEANNLANRQVKASQELAKLKQQEIDLQKRASQEAIAAKRTELGISQQQLAAAQAKAQQLRNEADNVVDRVALSSPRERRELLRAVESSKDNELTVKEAQLLQGISRFQGLVRSTLESDAISKDPSGFVAQVLKDARTAEGNAKKIGIDVTNKQELIFKLEEDAEANAVKLAEKLRPVLLKLLNSEANAQAIIDEFKSAQNERNP